LRWRASNSGGHRAQERLVRLAPALLGRRADLHCQQHHHVLPVPQVRLVLGGEACERGGAAARGGRVDERLLGAVVLVLAGDAYFYLG
jgi:hypothetical protein